MTKAEAIEAFTLAGFTLTPLKGKAPYLPSWEKTPRGEWSVKKVGEQNYGVVLGPGDLVIDVDPRNFRPNDQPLQRLIARIGAVSTFTVRTGGGGLHIYLKKPVDLLVRNGLPDFPGVEFKAGPGRQVVGPGSVHPDTGKPYLVVSGFPDRVQAAPQALLDLVRRTEVPFDEVGTGTYVNDAMTQGRYLDYLQHQAPPSIEGQKGDENAFKVACRGRDLGLPPAIALELMLEVWNPRCRPAWGDEELRAKVTHAYRYARGAVGGMHPAAVFEAVDPIEALRGAPAAPAAAPLSWVTTPQGKIVKCLQNLLNYLQLPNGGLHKVFAYSDFTGRVEFVAPAPWHRGKMPRSRWVGDDDLKLLRGHLATRHGFEASIPDIETALTNVAYHDRFHPVRDYLKALKWDGKRRLDTWIKDYLGGVDEGFPDYLAAVSRKTLCGAVARIFEPGITFDHVLLLEGRQDLGKSSAIRILGGQWASDAPVDAHSRDTIDAMQGRWIIEMAEMEVYKRTEEEALKAFITRPVDRARLAYGRTTGEFPRQSIFIATKNPREDGAFFRDEENRRWWPVRLEPRADPRTGLAQVDFTGLKTVRDQLFAEALVVWRQGEKLSMETAGLKSQATQVAGQRRVAPEWAEPVAEWIRRLVPGRDFVTGREVFIEALAGTDRLFDRRSMLAVAAAMRAAGWDHKVKRDGSILVKGYAPLSEAEIWRREKTGHLSDTELLSALS